MAPIDHRPSGGKDRSPAQPAISGLFHGLEFKSLVLSRSQLGNRYIHLPNYLGIYLDIQSISDHITVEAGGTA